MFSKVADNLLNSNANLRTCINTKSFIKTQMEMTNYITKSIYNFDRQKEDYSKFFSDLPLQFVAKSIKSPRKTSLFLKGKGKNFP